MRILSYALFCQFCNRRQLKLTCPTERTNLVPRAFSLAYRMRPDFVANLIMISEFSWHPNISGYATHKGRNRSSALQRSYRNLVVASFHGRFFLLQLFIAFGKIRLSNALNRSRIAQAQYVIVKYRHTLYKSSTLIKSAERS